MSTENLNEYTMTTDELAAALGVSGGRVRQLIVAGRISDGILRAGSWFFKPSAIHSYERRQAGRPPGSKKKTEAAA